MSVVIEAKNLTKMYKMYGNQNEKILSFLSKRKFEKFYALNNVSFEISTGECVGIIGHNGAGKSTLLKILTGVAFATTGELNINGKISSLLELGSGFNPELSGIENIYFNGTLNGLTTKEIDEKKEDIIEFADIGDFVYQPVKSYSSGMFARLAFAVAINIDPDILIVDEILSVGDVGFQVKCMEKFEEFKKSGRTIIYVSHGLGTVKKFCDRAIWLQKGAVVDDGNSVIVVERYYNISFNPAVADKAEEGESNVMQNISLTSPKKVLSYREDLNLEFNYEVLKEIESPRVVFELRKTDYEPGTTRGSDQFICAFDSVDEHINIKGLKGSNKFTLNLEDVSLVAGVYYLDVVVISGGETIYRKVNAFDFTMEDKYRGEGFLILEHSWKK